jgi:hypothetical protein
MTDVGLAALLRPLGVRSGTVRVIDGTTVSTPKGYYLEAFKDAFIRADKFPGQLRDVRHELSSRSLGAGNMQPL